MSVYLTSIPIISSSPNVVDFTVLDCCRLQSTVGIVFRFKNIFQYNISLAFLWYVFVSANFTVFQRRIFCLFISLYSYRLIQFLTHKLVAMKVFNVTTRSFEWMANHEVLSCWHLERKTQFRNCSLANIVVAFIFFLNDFLLSWIFILIIFTFLSIKLLLLFQK